MKKLIVSALALSVLFISCDKEALLPETDSSQENSKSTVLENYARESEEFPYEFYNPEEEEVLEESLIDLFTEGSEQHTTKIEKAIWLWESGTNYFHPSPNNENSENYVSHFDNIITTSKEVFFDVEENEISNEVLKEKMVQTHEEILSTIDESTIHYVTDVQFNEIVDGQLSLQVVSFFYVNPVIFSGPGDPTPITLVDKKAGKKQDCQSIGVLSGAWTDVAILANGPRPNIITIPKIYGNVYTISSFGNPMYIFNMPSNSGALATANVNACIPGADINIYGTYYYKWLNSVVKYSLKDDYVISFNVWPNTIPYNTSVNWEFDAVFGEITTKKVTHSLSASTLFY